MRLVRREPPGSLLSREERDRLIRILRGEGRAAGTAEVDHRILRKLERGRRGRWSEHGARRGG